MQSPGRNKLHAFTRNELTKLKEKKRVAEERVREVANEIAKLGRWHLNTRTFCDQLQRNGRVINEVTRNRITWTWYTQDGYITNFEQVTDEGTRAEFYSGSSDDEDEGQNWQISPSTPLNNHNQYDTSE
jgi:hypothetical protein